jgi:hypothetical protein
MDSECPNHQQMSKVIKGRELQQLSEGLLQEI